MIAGQNNKACLAVGLHDASKVLYAKERYLGVYHVDGGKEEAADGADKVDVAAVARVRSIMHCDKQPHKEDEDRWFSHNK